MQTFRWRFSIIAIQSTLQRILAFLNQKLNNRYNYLIVERHLTSLRHAAHFFIDELREARKNSPKAVAGVGVRELFAFGLSSPP